ncbi:hypothetical protein LOZ53_005571 [Ophidiomyces ophidiicola]|nr:hypothetical protein LOZ53_005571 [Ophidiomyces ophidiicola]
MPAPINGKYPHSANPGETIGRSRGQATALQQKSIHFSPGASAPSRNEQSIPAHAPHTIASKLQLPPVVHHGVWEKNTKRTPDGYEESLATKMPLKERRQPASTRDDNEEERLGVYGVSLSASPAGEKRPRFSANTDLPLFCWRRHSASTEFRHRSVELGLRDTKSILQEQDNTAQHCMLANATSSSAANASETVSRMSKCSQGDLEANSGGSLDIRVSEVMAIGNGNQNDRVEPERAYHRGVLSRLLRLHHSRDTTEVHERSIFSSILPSQHTNRRTFSVGQMTPCSKQKWYEKTKNLSSSSLRTSVSDSPRLFSGGLNDSRHLGSNAMLGAAAKKLSSLPHPEEEEIRTRVPVAKIISRQRYVVQLCQALMRYGAPTHRLEEYMHTTARALELDAQFLYLPGCMFVSFSNVTTHTTELKLLRYPQGVDLGRLADVHQVYKEIVHDIIGVEEATQKLDDIMNRNDQFNKWWLIFLYGCASATVGPFAFGAGVQDMPVAFLLGCVMGALNYLVVPRFPLYSNVFELTAALATSFLARALGSIPAPSGESRRLFCFPAVAQSAIALILPGYIVLCSSLELQSRNMLAGSVRLVYAIIYSLVLGFGLMLGTAFYGSIDPAASSASACGDDAARFGGWNEYARKFPAVALFTMCLIMIHQAKWTQTPVMLMISVAGYAVTFFSAKRFPDNTQVASALGAFVIGVLGNLYSRLRHGLAVAAMLPAIFVQVPSGLAASGSLVAGLAFANGINGNSTALDIGTSKVYGGVVFDLAYGMVQISISISGGLFLAALVVYPLGKRRSGLFSL